MQTERSDHYRAPDNHNPSQKLFVRVDSILSNSSLFASPAAMLTKEARKIDTAIATISTEFKKLCTTPLQHTDEKLLELITNRRLIYLQIHQNTNSRRLKKNGLAVLGVGLCALIGFGIGNEIDHENNGALSGALVGLFLYSFKSIIEVCKPNHCASYESMQLCFYSRRESEITMINKLKKFEESLEKLFKDKNENKEQLEKINAAEKTTGSSNNARLTYEDFSSDISMPAVGSVAITI